MKKAVNEIKRGQSVSFRIPSDTPDHILKHLQKLKEVERRNFSSKIAEFVLQGVSQSYTRERETITIPLPKQLSKIQRDWLKHEHSEALLGNIIYQLITDPVRSTSLLAAFNSNSSDIDRALYLQEEPLYLQEEPVLVEETIHPPIYENRDEVEVQPDTPFENAINDLQDDLNDFDWEKAMKDQNGFEEEKSEDTEEDLDGLLGGFLAQMNK